MRMLDIYLDILSSQTWIYNSDNSEKWEPENTPLFKKKIWIISNRIYSKFDHPYVQELFIKTIIQPVME